MGHKHVAINRGTIMAHVCIGWGFSKKEDESVFKISELTWSGVDQSESSKTLINPCPQCHQTAANIQVKKNRG